MDDPVPAAAAPAFDRADLAPEPQIAPPLPVNESGPIVHRLDGFDTAWRFIRDGGHAWRTGWNADGQWVALYTGVQGPMSRPYYYISTRDQVYVPWVPTQSDLLEMDWVGIFPEPDPSVR